MRYVSVYGLSDRGCRREDNQDAILVGGIMEKSECYLRLPREGYYIYTKGLLCAVADGMGGHRGGNEAGLLTLEMLAANESSLAACDEPGAACLALEELIVSIHKKVLRESKTRPELTGMGSTLTGVYLRPSYSIYYHVGDSRLYRYRGDYLAQLSEDHTLESLSQRATGEICTGAKRGIITNCVGGGDQAGCKPRTGTISFTEKDRLLLCSDGLSDMLSMEKIEAIIACRDDLMATGRNLVQSAREAGGYDNITAVLIEIG